MISQVRMETSLAKGDGSLELQQGEAQTDGKSHRIQNQRNKGLSVWPQIEEFVSVDSLVMSEPEAGRHFKIQGSVKGLYLEVLTWSRTSHGVALGPQEIPSTGGLEQQCILGPCS